MERDRRAPRVSVQRSFVVQLFEGPEPLAGRVEHIVSGQARAFSSVEELLAFFGNFRAEPGPVEETDNE